MVQLPYCGHATRVGLGCDAALWGWGRSCMRPNLKVIPQSESHTNSQVSLGRAWLNHTMVYPGCPSAVIRCSFVSPKKSATGKQLSWQVLARQDWELKNSDSVGAGLAIQSTDSQQKVIARFSLGHKSSVFTCWFFICLLVLFSRIQSQTAFSSVKLLHKTMIRKSIFG